MINPDIETIAAAIAAATAAAWLLPAARQRLGLALAKHPSLTGHVCWAKRIAAWIPSHRYQEPAFFASDGASAEVVAQRRAAFHRLAEHFARSYPASLAMTGQARAILPDLQFTGARRVPFPYSDQVRQHVGVGAFVQASEGVMLEDLDGNRLFDLAGSCGVSLFGYDFYKSCIAEGARRVQDLGPVLGAYHPCVLYNLRRLREVSGHDEVSFHMSGTDAVMQAVRLARCYTGRSHVVRFCGADGGWWDEVQPGPGNPLPARQTYTLRDMHERSLSVLRTRGDIACVLVNPLQALHPHAAAPGDWALVDSSRSAGFDRQATTDWLQRLRQVCTERGIVLVFDEVFMGLRLAPGGAQEYFGVHADLVTYGNTLGGGLPVGVVCGRADLMRRYRADRPADMCFARGTFSAHPYVMGAMQVFLERLHSPEVKALYEGMDARWNTRAAQLNGALQGAGVPVAVAHMATVWTIVFTRPARYNWMLQFYLRQQGLALSWVGSGRMVFSLNYTSADFDQVVQRFMAAAVQMQADGWWSAAPDLTNKRNRRSILREALRHRFRPRPG